MKLNKEIKEKINEYLALEKKPLICIVWPTWSWKTKFAVELALEYNWEIINADSRQIYKWIECITGLNYDEISSIKNYLFWVKEIYEKFTVVDFLNEVRLIISNIHLKWKLPIVAWWTWLFISSLIEWFEIHENSLNNEIRKSFEWKSNDQLLEELSKVDLESANSIHVNNRVYLERALEVFYSSWFKKSEWIKDKNKAYNALIISKKIETELERELLYQRINDRQKLLFDNSFEIIKNLILKWYDLNLQAMQSIWIPEINNYSDGKLTKDEAILIMQKKARNYAKRQLTWWRPKKWKFKIVEI